MLAWLERWSPVLCNTPYDCHPTPWKFHAIWYFKSQEKSPDLRLSCASLHRWFLMFGLIKCVLTCQWGNYIDIKHKYQKATLQNNSTRYLQTVNWRSHSLTNLLKPYQKLELAGQPSCHLLSIRLQHLCLAVLHIGNSQNGTRSNVYSVCLYGKWGSTKLSLDWMLCHIVYL